MTLFEILLIAQASVALPPNCPKEDVSCDPWAEFRVVVPAPESARTPKDERIGRGPHTLIVGDGSSFAKIEYRTGAACKIARDEARRQITGARIQAFCVPR